MSTANPALSFVIPLYNSAETIGAVVRDIEDLAIEGGHEIILVNDGSRDATGEVCRELLRTVRVPVTYVEHARNYGEHNAVLTGWRHASGGNGQSGTFHGCQVNIRCHENPVHGNLAGSFDVHIAEDAHVFIRRCGGPVDKSHVKITRFRRKYFYGQNVSPGFYQT